MKRVLIIPSWYPTPKKKTGFFFQEQANAMEGLFDIRVLYLQDMLLSRKKHLVKYVLQKFLNKYEYEKIYLNGETIYTNPALFYYEYKRFEKKPDLAIIIELYANVLKNFMDNGWVPDVLHAQTIMPAGIISNALSKMFGIPYIITEHNFFSLPAFEESIRPLVKESMEKADKLLTVSFDKSRQILSYGIQAKPIVVGNLVNEKKFPIQPAYQCEERLEIITITAASFIKDNLTMLKIMKEIKRIGINFHTTIIGIDAWGNEQERKKIYEYITIEGLENHIEVIGFVERDDLPHFFARKHVFVLTSIAEGLPVSVLEAMASGLYILATKHGGTEDLITSRTYGTLINLQDYQAGAAALEKIARGELRYDPLKIRKRVVETYGYQAFRQRMATIYDEAIATKTIQ